MSELATGPDPVDRHEMRLIARGWDAVADDYATAFFDELDGKPQDRALLHHFAMLAAGVGGEVLDLGCGPGQVTEYLSDLGIPATGVDSSREMIRVARSRNLGINFRVSDMLALTPTPNSLGGVVAMYSLINIVRGDVPKLLAKLHRGIRPKGPLLIAVHEGVGTTRLAELFGQPIPMAATLYGLEEMKELVTDAGFELIFAESRAPLDTEQATRRIYLLGRRAAPSDPR